MREFYIRFAALPAAIKLNKPAEVLPHIPLPAFICAGPLALSPLKSPAHLVSESLFD